MIIPGFYINAVEAGFKPNRPDLGLIYIPDAVGSAAVFTTNHFKAACVQVTQSSMRRHITRAILVNAGNANAATGREGVQNAKQSAKWVATALGLSAGEVALASTGVIGVQLPMDIMKSGISMITHHPYQNDMELFSRAIMTTDLVPKMIHETITYQDRSVQILGFAKGSGMIAPKMGTMLGFILTDAPIPSDGLSSLLKEVVADTFNAVSVDTDTSTNDMVIAVASGKSSYPTYQAEAWGAFKDGFYRVCESLSQQIARDGEGATKLLTVHVMGASSKHDALLVARSVAESPLVKTAIHGADPNWGRVAMAIGKTNAKINPNKVDIQFGPHLIMKGGVPIAWDRELVIGYLQGDTVTISIHLNVGKEAARLWGCDLSKGYIEINVDYT